MTEMPGGRPPQRPGMKAAAGGSIGGDSGQPPQSAGAKAKRVAGQATNVAVEQSLNAATGGVGGIIYRILPKPTDPPEERSKKKRRLAIGACLAFAGMFMSMLGPFILAMAMFGVFGGGASGAVSNVEAGECRSFSSPRVVQGGAGAGPGAAAGSLGAPLDEQFMNTSDSFGQRDPGAIGTSFHDGLDFAAANINGAPIYAVGDGEVTVAKANPGGYGNYVVIRHNIDGQIVDSLYGHMDDGNTFVTQGQQVTAGQHIANVGNAGMSSGPHLHFGIYAGGWAAGAGIDPMPWISKFRATAGSPGGAAPAPGSPAPAPGGTPADPGSDAGPPPEGLDPYPLEGNQKQETLTPEQQANIKAMISAARESDISNPARAATIAAVLSGQATHFISKPYVNDVTPVGIFDEIPLGGAEVRNIGSNPKFAATGLYNRLKTVEAGMPDWATRPVADVITAMYPERVSVRDEFATWEQLARQSVAGMWNERNAQPGATIQQVSALSERDCDIGATGGALLEGSVPEHYVKWLQLAGSLCEGITSPLLAAQLSQENKFRDGSDSPMSQAGAQGPAQFMPGTWMEWGTTVDEGGNPTSAPGQGSINAVPDAVMAQGRFMCSLYDQAVAAIASGRVQGDPVELALAGYNAGFGAVLNAGGLPSGGGYTTETQPYVRKIIESAAQYTAPTTPMSGAVGATGNAVVDAALQWLGTTYAWGGGNTTGPTQGIRDGGPADRHGDFNKIGFDCSGLVQYAVFQATGKTVMRLAADQVNDPQGITITNPADLQPGDVIGPNPQHIYIYMGNNQVVEAPQSGDVVKISTITLPSTVKAKRF